MQLCWSDGSVFFSKVAQRDFVSSGPPLRLIHSYGLYSAVTVSSLASKPSDEPYSPQRRKTDNILPFVLPPRVLLVSPKPTEGASNNTSGGSCGLSGSPQCWAGAHASAH